MFLFFFFFNDTATTEIYTLSLHDALPISLDHCANPTRPRHCLVLHRSRQSGSARRDRKSTRLNSSHSQISYAVFCLKKKKRLHHMSRQTLSITRLRTAYSQAGRHLLPVLS